MWNIIKKLFGIEKKSAKIEFKLMKNSTFTAGNISANFEGEKDRSSQRK
ncbi:MAG: hypothetical protein ACI9S8_001959 [Chlamydiales bacterium]|jgi:hypothetical protein